MTGKQDNKWTNIMLTAGILAGTYCLIECMASRASTRHADGEEDTAPQSSRITANTISNTGNNNPATICANQNREAEQQERKNIMEDNAGNTPTNDSSQRRGNVSRVKRLRFWLGKHVFDFLSAAVCLMFATFMLYLVKACIPEGSYSQRIADIVFYVLYALTAFTLIITVLSSLFAMTATGTDSTAKKMNATATKKEKENDKKLIRDIILVLAGTALFGSIFYWALQPFQSDNPLKTLLFVGGTMSVGMALILTSSCP